MNPRIAAPADHAGGEGAWQTTVHTEDGALAAGSPPGADWDALWHRCPGATAFQHRAWLEAWWEAYGPAGRMRLILVRRQGTAVAGAALYTVPHDPLRRLRLVGAGLSDYGDVLLTGPDRAGAAARLTAAITGLGRPADLREVAPGSAALELAEIWPRRTYSYPDSLCLGLPAGGFDHVLEALPHRTAARVRAKVRKIDRLGLHGTPTPPEASADAVDALLRLHAEQWRGRGINPEHLNERFAAHLRSAVPALIEDHSAELLRFHADGELKASELLLFWDGTVASYLNGVSPDLRHKIDVATLFMREGLRLAEEHGAKRYSLLRGHEPYKLRWQPEAEISTRLLLGAGGAARPESAALAASARLRTTAVRTARALRRRTDDLTVEPSRGDTRARTRGSRSTGKPRADSSP